MLPGNQPILSGPIIASSPRCLSPVFDWGGATASLYIAICDSEAEYRCGERAIEARGAAPADLGERPQVATKGSCATIDCYTTNGRLNVATHIQRTLRLCPTALSCALEGHYISVAAQDMHQTRPYLSLFTQHKNIASCRLAFLTAADTDTDIRPRTRTFWGPQGARTSLSSVSLLRRGQRTCNILIRALNTGSWRPW
jgi:hypothetical protein